MSRNNSASRTNGHGGQNVYDFDPDKAYEHLSKSNAKGNKEATEVLAAHIRDLVAEKERMNTAGTAL